MQCHSNLGQLEGVWHAISNEEEEEKEEEERSCADEMRRAAAALLYMYVGAHPSSYAALPWKR